MAVPTTSRRSSWMDNYENVEELPAEQDGFLASGATTPPTTTATRVFSPSPLNPGTPRPSSSASVNRSSTCSSGGGPKSPAVESPPRFVRAASSFTVGPRIPSEEARILSSPGSRGSMILYHLPADGPLEPPPNMRRLTMVSTSSRDSTISYSSDSKYPAHEHNIQAYLYDPEMDAGNFDKEDQEVLQAERQRIGWRGAFNIGMLCIIILGLIALFVAYPLVAFSNTNDVNARIVHNKYINETGQADGF
ncbi:hypothetical protein CYLTODRAFT_485484 [Cylindrobasidium torrendii FP15055 ss-10]|uniref:Glycoside hydrolase family 16 protein n=1 Tax=Cylindrobasidium torrendii FP15055 ss-10 TaxID=1314674 RepID=A0A0D7BUM7_9AGAR|nr:hypothetical protein CYLTODRAFT_485484 [Cylindrobasidium torrendii FP15055 ss-10]